ncbi:unnamed protein product [Arctia plantaginis]|uniref:Uncharacterized protein n=1 Tax=Arctia plantaginis TaxID=874455 RepID=A0A8S0YP22_ARCPL|nr:unnamed protein product [Arctia plantaginis]
MKLVILVACALMAIAVAAPPEPPKIVRSEYEQSPDGGYSYTFETDDGVVRQETGVIKEAFDEENKPHNVVVVRGSYSYKNPDGIVEAINYSADENGFKAEGDSIPKNPPVRR